MPSNESHELFLKTSGKFGSPCTTQMNQWLCICTCKNNGHIEIPVWQAAERSGCSLERAIDCTCWQCGWKPQLIWKCQIYCTGEESVAQCGCPQRSALAVLRHHRSQLLHRAFWGVSLDRDPVSGNLFTLTLQKDATGWSHEQCAAKVIAVRKCPDFLEHHMHASHALPS